MGILGIGFDAAWIGCPAAAAVAAMILANAPRIRGTTLVAPAAWAAVAALAAGGVELWLATRGGPHDRALASLPRYAAACGTLTPLMAVLGAKRPQNRGWQWVVASLWIVLLVPAMHAVAAKSTGRFEIAGIWQALIWGMLALGLANYLATRRAAAAVVAVTGQWLLLASCLHANPPGDENTRAAAGLALLAAAAALAGAGARRRVSQAALRCADQRTEGSSFAALNQRWLAFRDRWGAFWALRVLQRLNQSAETARLPARLEWTGWTPPNAAPDEISPATVAALAKSMDAVLWRFERQT